MSNFFSKNGKQLKGYETTIKHVETINSLSDLKPLYESIQIKWKSLFSSLAMTAVSFGAVLLVIAPSVKASVNIQKYNIFSSRPFVMEDVSNVINTGDSRSQKINAVFKEFNCPLYGYGETFVTEADKNNIPWWLVASVSFQESNCGKKTPLNDGQETYNAYGWGVWGGNAFQFDNWEHGVAVVSRYMSTKFFSKGVTEPCTIMATYTPPSNGSWCRGVQYFGDIIQNYESPDYL